MKFMNALAVLTALSLAGPIQGQGNGNGNGIGNANGNANGNGNGQGNGNGNGNGGGNGKPPGNSGGNGNGSGKPCGVGLGPRDNPGAEHQSSKAAAHFDNLPRTCDDSIKIDIDLGNGKMKTFHKGRSTAPGLGRPNALGYWYGTDEDGGSFNFVRDKDGLVHGSFMDKETGDVHQFGIDMEGNQVVTITPTELFPPEADPIDETPEMESNNRALQGSTSSLRGISRNLEQEGRMLGDDSGSNIDVMVIWTKKSECKRAGLPENCAVTSSTYNAMEALVELAVAETNTAFINSGIHTQINLVYSNRHATYVEPSFGGALSDLRGASDGKMDEIHGLRDQYGADMVAMIIDDPQYCGLGYLGPRSDLMFSVSSWNCATGYYSFGHELGHNLGLNHDRGEENACTSSASNYGYRDPNADFRSIMAYNCVSGQCDNNPGGGCPRVQMFSNTQYNYNGKAIGSPLANSVVKINAVAAAVAAYKPHKPTTVTCNSGEDAFKLVLTLDNYPAETTWSVKNSGGSTLLTGGPYASSQSGAVIEVEECFPDAPSTFEIKDSWGDGVCCGYGQGGYKVYWDGALKASGGSFGSSESTTFGGCANYANWYDSYGDNCSWYEAYENPGCPYWGDKANAGLGTPGQACCHCGGGIDV